VEDPAELPPAIAHGLEATRRGQPALLDLSLQPI